MFLDALVGTLSQSIFRYKPALDYLASRNVNEEEIKRYKIGYAKYINVPDDGTPDRKRFMEENWKGKKFENMVIFPLQDGMGRVLGITGRSISDNKLFNNFITEEAKFMGFFFGLAQALPHIYRTGRAFVVEGPFDTLAFSKVFPNTLGAMTAGISDAQRELLNFYAKQVVPVFDNDGPGRAAVRKIVVEEQWPEIEPLDLGYKDPAEALARLSEPGFRKFVERKVKDVPPVLIGGME